MQNTDKCSEKDQFLMKSASSENSQPALRVTVLGHSLSLPQLVPVGLFASGQTTKGFTLGLEGEGTAVDVLFL